MNTSVEFPGLFDQFNVEGTKQFPYGTGCNGDYACGVWAILPGYPGTTAGSD